MQCNAVHVLQGQCVLESDHIGEHVYEFPERGKAAEKVKQVTG